MKYFSYSCPNNSVLKKNGVKFLPSTEDVEMAKEILSIDFKEHNLKEYWYKDVVKSAIRAYAYYILHPEQFNKNPDNIIGHCLRRMYNSAYGFARNINKINKSPAVRTVIIEKYKERALQVWYNTAKSLADQIKNKELFEEFLEEKSNKMGTDISGVNSSMPLV
jgi:hypothetical protein